MSSEPTDTRLGAWEQREGPAMAAVPFALLAVSVGITVLVGERSHATLVAILALSALAAGWLGLGLRLPRLGSGRSPPAAAHLAVLVAIMAALTVLAPWFGFFAWTGYLLVPRALPRRWMMLGVAPVAAVVALSQVGGAPALEAGALTGYLLLVLVNMAVAGGFLWFAWVGREQDQQRRQAMAELTEANARLDASLEENAELHERLVTQARVAGVADERGRIAREIHDTIAQGLAGIITQLEAAGRGGPSDPAWRRHHDSAARLARESLTEARRSVQDLRPEALETARLPEALGEIAMRWSTLHDVPAELVTTGEARAMRPEIEVALLRTAQAALANVGRHARASRVGLTLSYMGDLVSLDVRDDGVGFRVDGAPSPGVPAAAGPGGATALDVVAPPASGGFGLIGMRERVAGLDGTLEIESEPGGGTAVSATLPALLAGGPT